MTPVSGVLQERFPYVRFGTGGEPLVVLPGLALDNQVPGRAVARSYAWAFRRLAAGRDVMVLRRPHGLDAPASTRPAGKGADGRQLGTIDIADAYAAVIRSELGAVDLLALSTGGLIGQHVALRHPDLVSRLALVVAGNRLAEPGRAMCHRWLRLHREERWGALRGELAAAAVDGAAPQWLARRLGGSGRSPDPTDAADFAATVAADLEHDTTGLLGGVKAAVLVVGGKDDPFFPEDVLRATAAEIPGAALAVHGGGHGLPKHHARWLQDQVVDFFARSPSDEQGRLAPPPGGDQRIERSSHDPVHDERPARHPGDGGAR